MARRWQGMSGGRWMGAMMWLALVAGGMYTAQVHADEPAEGIAQFVRIRKDSEDRPIAMQTAIQRYTKTDSNGQTIAVDLIGVVHVGEKEYYDELNRRFEGYDALLYELVAPEGTKVNRGEERGGPVSGLQTGMKDALGLEFQLDHIDYHKDNFVHADMSPEEFVESMTNNDESFLKMFFRAMGAGMARQGSEGSMDNGSLFAAMFSSDREMNMRRQMAGELSGGDSAMVALSGENGSTIIHHRNGKCFEVLQREIDGGKRTLGVFYGAGHLEDMEDRLLAMGFTPSGSREWLVAWKLTRDDEAIRAATEADNTPAAEAPAAEAPAADGNEAAGEEPAVESGDSGEVGPATQGRVRRGGLWRIRRR